MPNTKFKAPGAPAESYSDVLVHGRITAVKKGIVLPAQQGSDQRTVHLRVRVIETLAGELPRETVTVGYVISAEEDLNYVRDLFSSLDSVVLPLYKGFPVHDYDSGVYSITGDGKLFTVVQPSGRLYLPAFHSERQQELLGDVDTLAELTRVAKQPTQTISLQHGSK